MPLKDRIIKLRQDNPLFTVSDLVEITLYGDQQDRERDFLSIASSVLKCPQSEVDEAIAFTGEIVPEAQATADIKKEVDGLVEDSRVRIETLAQVLRACIAADPFHAGMALALINAEQITNTENEK